MKKKLIAYILLFRLNRPIGYLLVIWPTLTALWLAAEGMPDIDLLLIFIAGAIVVRSAGCAINDYLDREFDGQVKRTENRPLATGALSANEALLGFLGMAFLGLILVLQLNQLTLYLAVVAIALTASYPLFKRFTHLPQVYLGLAMNWGIIMAYSAQTNTIDSRIFILYLATILWTIVYDTYYAVADREDDIKAGIKSTAILWQGKIAKVTALLQIGYLALVVCLASIYQLKPIYYAGIIAIAGLFLYHQYLTRQGDPQQNFKAFLHNQHVGWVLFLSVVASS